MSVASVFFEGQWIWLRPLPAWRLLFWCPHSRTGLVVWESGGVQREKGASEAGPRVRSPAPRTGGFGFFFFAFRVSFCVQSGAGAQLSACQLQAGPSGASQVASVL